MAEKETHPSINEFKAFVKDHPGLIKEVRKKGSSWQPYYEKWVLLGEDDPSWEKYKDVENTGSKDASRKQNSKKDNKQQEIMSQLMKIAENVDLNKVEAHINQLNGAIGNIQSLIGQFRDVKKQFPSKNSSGNPFPMNKD